MERNSIDEWKSNIITKWLSAKYRLYSVERGFCLGKKKNSFSKIFFKTEHNNPTEKKDSKGITQILLKHTQRHTQTYFCPQSSSGGKKKKREDPFWL